MRRPATMPLRCLLLRCLLSLPSRKAAPPPRCPSRRPISPVDPPHRRSPSHTPTMTPAMISDPIIPAPRCPLTRRSAPGNHSQAASSRRQQVRTCRPPPGPGNRSPREAPRQAMTRTSGGGRKRTGYTRPSWTRRGSSSLKGSGISSPWVRVCSLVSIIALA
jgi:hypothetical protein